MGEDCGLVGNKGAIRDSYSRRISELLDQFNTAVGDRDRNLYKNRNRVTLTKIMKRSPDERHI